MYVRACRYSEAEFEALVSRGKQLRKEGHTTEASADFSRAATHGNASEEQQAEASQLLAETMTCGQSIPSRLLH